MVFLFRVKGVDCIGDFFEVWVCGDVYCFVGKDIYMMCFSENIVGFCLVLFFDL